MRCQICEQKVVIGSNLDHMRRVDGKLICEKCLITFKAIKKMSDSIGIRVWNGIRLSCRPYKIHKNREVFKFKTVANNQKEATNED